MRVIHGIPALLGLLLLSGCDQDHHPQPPRTTAPGVIQMALPGDLGHSDRPAVEFDHQQHAKALEQEGCAACHPENSERQLLPRLDFKKELSDSTVWMESHHDLCIGCHDERRQAGKSTGPDDCGECHVRHQAPFEDVSREMGFDYSLHFRHSRAFEDKCEACHHVRDEAQGKLVYQKGAEDACGACHQPVAAKDETSLGDAVHTACINCHIERQGKEGQKTGPRQCEGCHGAKELAKIEKVKDAPRPDRGQPEAMWIASKGVTGGAVAFDHRLHEGQVDSCSACHHESLSKCDECHTQLPGAKGEAVTLKHAYHTPDSALSCVGCHKEHSSRGECAGCHHMLPVPPGQAACELCHSGPPPEGVDPKTSALAVSSPRELPALPDVSADFPDELEIEVLVDRYQPAKFPHGKIVAALDRVVRGSGLAKRFHQGTETLCAGCHHNGPPGEPITSCRSCHGDETYPRKDLPALNAAYHRQCIGCHQAIGHKAQGCTDCHEELSK